MREFDLIDWIRSQTRLDPRAVPVGPGDDCAVVRVGGEDLLVTVDQVLDGVHVQLAACGPQAVGRKAMARNLSDIAAMAGTPLAAVANVALPRDFPDDDAKAIYLGLRAGGDAFRCPLVGGDIGVWDGALCVGVTVLGRPTPAGPVLRSGARPGDALCVTGALGGSWRSGRDLTFTPRIHEALALAAACELHAMIDLSDGLSRDLGHVCRESGVGAEILATRVPVHPDAGGLDAALSDGEDYELLFALPPGRADALERDGVLGVPVTRVGTITAERNVTLVHPDGSREPLIPHGWEHGT